jgi:hypothetical protein
MWQSGNEVFKTYHVLLKITKTCKSHTTDENLFLPTVTDVVTPALENEDAKKLKLILL